MIDDHRRIVKASYIDVIQDKAFIIYLSIIITSRKPVWCTGKLLKIKSKDILIFFFF